MNNKEFQIELAKRLSITQKECSNLMNRYIDEIVDNFANQERELPLFALGTLEVKEKNERLLVNPKTGIKMNIPKKLVLTFKPSSTLKSRYK